MKLSSEMEKCLNKAKECGGLIRRPGGYWTGEKVKRDAEGVPEWNFGTLTIHALVNRGKLIPTRFMDRGDAYFVEPAKEA